MSELPYSTGPYGLFGAAEGVSYLIVAGFVFASFYTKVSHACPTAQLPRRVDRACRMVKYAGAHEMQARTGSGLPAGPGGLLGAAEGLSYLTAAAGLAVLVFQLVDYGYIPNAVPVVGGICS